jgi:DNA repair exonuclease SbcCD ATPase subunit
MPKRIYNPISSTFYCRNQGISQGLINDESKNDCNDLLNRCCKLEKENKKLKKLLKQYEKDINDLREKDDINKKKIDNLNKKINALNYNDDEIQELYKKLTKLQKELNKNKRKNESLSNENDDLNNSNNILMKENEKYKKIIEKLKDKLKECEENRRNRSSHSQTKNSMTEDELVIINKECTYNNGVFGSEINKEKYLKNNDFKKDIKLSENDIFKYHEIIQELSNMLLIYEHLYFNREVKPKNNIELLCYLISHFIEKKIRKIKLNAFFKILISSIGRNNNYRENKRNNYLNERYNYENTSKRGQGNVNKHKKGYYIERNNNDIY